MTDSDSPDPKTDADLAQMSEHPETPIDAAWAAAGETPDDASAAHFIDVVLAEPLICPVWDPVELPSDGAPTGASPIDAGPEAEDDPYDEDDDEEDSDELDANIAPKMIELEGVETLLLFDSEERLAAFVDEPTEFIALPGRAFFEMMAEAGVQIALNLDVAPSSTVFSAESVGSIAELLAETEEEEEIDLGSAPMALRAPRDISPAALEALGVRLNAARDVLVEAWLVDLEEDLGDASGQGLGEPRRVLALVAKPGAEIAAHEAGRDAVRLVGAADPTGMSVDLAFLYEDDALLERARAVGFGLLRADA